MALPFFEKKQSTTGKGYIPADRVRDLASKGFSEPEIIDILRKEGFSPEEIDKSLTQALKMSVTTETPTFPSLAPTSSSPQTELPTLEQLQPVTPTKLEVPETSLPQEYYAYSTEEYLDYLIAQRAAEIYSRIDELAERNEELSKRLDELNSKIMEIEKEKLSEKQTTFSKMEELKNYVEDVSSRIVSLERAFKDTLPNLVESVRTLADIIQKLKKGVATERPE